MESQDKQVRVIEEEENRSYIINDYYKEETKQDKQSKIKAKVSSEIYDYINQRRMTINEVYQEVINKKSNLSKRQRDFVLSLYDKDGNFIK